MIHPGIRSPIETARALEPIIALHRDDAERNRQLSRPVFEALADAGLFKLFVPEKLGGLESDLTTLLDHPPCDLPFRPWPCKVVCPSQQWSHLFLPLLM